MRGPEARPLAGRRAVVTGVGRRAGIGFAVARRLADLGADLLVTAGGPPGSAPHGMDRS